MVRKSLPLILSLCLVLGFPQFVSGAGAYASVSVNVYLEDGDAPAVRHKTAAATVAAFLNEIDVVLYEKDMLNVALTDRVRDEMRIKIDRGFPLTLTLDGAPVTIRVSAGEAIGGIIAELKAKTGVQYLYDGLPNAMVNKNSRFELVSERYEITADIFLIPYEVYVYDITDLPEGEEVIANQGDPGFRQVVYNTRYVGGLEVSREIMSIVSISEPQAHVVFRGAPDSPLSLSAEPEPEEAPEDMDEGDRILVIDGEEVEYIACFSMSSSAYTAASTGRSSSSQYYGLTATGIIAERGVVAVDPEVIPLGAKLYVEGYGYATAADTGPSIKGAAIDLYYETLAEAKQYGRQSVMVYMIRLP